MIRSGSFTYTAQHTIMGRKFVLDVALYISWGQTVSQVMRFILAIIITTAQGNEKGHDCVYLVN